MDIEIEIVKGLPPPAHPDEKVGLDTEIYGIPENKLHRPVGTFACLSVCMERDLKDWEILRVLYPDAKLKVYQIYDSADIAPCLERLAPGKWVFQNAKFDIRQMRRWAVIEPREVWDTMMIDQGLFGGYYSAFDLGALSLRWLHTFLPKETRDEFAVSVTMSDEMQRYAALDPAITLMVALEQIRYISETDETLDHYWLADHPAMWAILDMQPVHMDGEKWHEMALEFDSKAQAIQAGYEINLNSPAQVNAYLAGQLHHKGAYKSVDAEALFTLRDTAAAHGRSDLTHFIDDVLSYRTFSKMRGTYGDNWLEHHLEDGAYIYPDWKPIGALTGRMACSEPNMQNVPARQFPIFRTFFTASPDHILMGCDVAQQEPRILAKLSRDKFLTETLVAGRSPHIAVGADIFHDPSFSKKDPRYKVAKAANLGTSYGMTAQGLALRAGIPLDEAETFLRTYFRTMPGVKLYIESYRKLAFRQGYVRTLTGRRAWINPYTSKWENNAINSPIQGSAADQTKMAIGFMHQMARSEHIPFCLSMVIHDETVADVPFELHDQYAHIIPAAWNEAGRHILGDTIPMVVEMFEGDNWGCKGE